MQWDAHTNLVENHEKMCALTDLPVAGLLRDLKQLGLLETTLVIWGAEFGRLPMSQGGNGRDHNPHGYTMWFAGGGVKPGTMIGDTDEMGLRALEPRHPRCGTSTRPSCICWVSIRTVCGFCTTGGTRGSRTSAATSSRRGCRSASTSWTIRTVKEVVV